jgi:hypothetical protein
MNQERWKLLSKELKVMVSIYRLKESGEVPHFRNLLKETGLENASLHILDL